MQSYYSLITASLICAAATNVAVAADDLQKSACWKEAEDAYGIPQSVLKAVAKTESGFNPRAKNINKNGTEDIGLMQINSGWLPTLAAYGITRESLADPCTNIKVGAWILAGNAKRHGWNWDAIGAYNVGCAKLDETACKEKRNSYAMKIYAALHKSEEQMPYYGTVVAKPAAQTASVQAKTLVVTLATPATNQASAVTSSNAETDRVEQPALSRSIGGFLNYEDEAYGG